MLFIQQKYINFERFRAAVTVNMTTKHNMVVICYLKVLRTLSYHLQALTYPAL